MPELIDLEVARENMLKRIQKKKLREITVTAPKILQNISAEDLKAHFESRTIDDVERVAKMLLFRFGEDTMVVHLMLYGDYCWSDSDQKHRHVVLELQFEECPSVLINDWSSWVKVEVDLPAAHTVSGMLSRQYGVDPLKEPITENMLSDILSGHSRVGIKKMLMDQALFAGIGNAYADEILWDARIHPTMTGKNMLQEKRVAGLASSMSKVLNDALDTVRTLSESRDIHEQPRDFMKVYRKSGKACPRCGYMIACLKVNGRDTFVCEKCQQ